MILHHSAYWILVFDCLCEFQDFVPAEAQRTIREFRLRLSRNSENGAIDLVYHQEPFYLAAQLAGREAEEPNPGQAARYEELLRRRVEEAGALGTDEEVASFAKGGQAA